MPTSVEEIQAVLRVANEHKVPLWTHGTGRNNGYGGPAPRVRGSVIVSLRNMNRVLEINEECAYAVVEPGVRWFDLYEAIKAGEHRLMLSIADLGWGGVVGNTLDHGATYMPYGLDMGMQCGMEVVLADGTVMRTGHGGDARQQVLARLQARPGAHARPALHAVQLRDRDQDGRLADALPRGLHAPVAAGVEGRRHRAGPRDPAHADARRHRADGPADPQHRPARLGLLEPLAVVAAGRPDSRRRPRRHGPRARDRPLVHALRALRRRGGGRPPLRQDQGGLRRASTAPRCGGPSARPRTSRASSTRPSASRAASPTSSGTT